MKLGSGLQEELKAIHDSYPPKKRPNKCPRGHAYTPQNIVYTRGVKNRVYRVCRTCHNRASNDAYYRKVTAGVA